MKTVPWLLPLNTDVSLLHDIFFRSRRSPLGDPYRIEHMVLLEESTIMDGGDPVARIVLLSLIKQDALDAVKVLAVILSIEFN